MKKLNSIETLAKLPDSTVEDLINEAAFLFIAQSVVVAEVNTTVIKL